MKYLDESDRAQEQSEHARDQAGGLSWAIINIAPLAITSLPLEELLATLDPSEIHRARATRHERSAKLREKYLEEVRARWGNDLAALTSRIPNTGEVVGRYLVELARLTGGDLEDGPELRRRALNSALVHRLVRYTSRREPEFNSTDLKNAVTYAKQMLGKAVPNELPYITRTTDECRHLKLTIVDGLLTARNRAPRSEAVEVGEGDNELAVIGANEAVLLAKRDLYNKEGGEGGTSTTPKGKGKAKTEPISSGKTRKTATPRSGKGKKREHATIDETEAATTPGTEAGPSGNCPKCLFPVNVRGERRQEYPSEDVKDFMVDVIAILRTSHGECPTCKREITFTRKEIVLEEELSAPGTPTPAPPSQKRPASQAEVPSEPKRQRTFGTGGFSGFQSRGTAPTGVFSQYMALRKAKSQAATSSTTLEDPTVNSPTPTSQAPDMPPPPTIPQETSRPDDIPQAPTTQSSPLDEYSETVVRPPPPLFSENPRPVADSPPLRETPGARIALPPQPEKPSSPAAVGRATAPLAETSSTTAPREVEETVPSSPPPVAPRRSLRTRKPVKRD